MAPLSRTLARAKPPLASWPNGASRLLAACAVAALGPAGCGPSIAPTLTEAPPRAAAVTRAEGWIRHAGRESHEISQSIEVEGRCLAVTATGLRALSAGALPSKCEGPWEIAPRRLPPIAAVRRVDKGFAFLTEGGVAWLSDSPLGAPTGPLRPPVRIEPIGGAFVGLDAAGRPYTFDGEWKAAALPEGIALYAALATPRGLVALGAPESLWVSRDRGAHFTRADTDPPGVTVAATDLERTPQGELHVLGRAGDLEWDPKGTFRPLASHVYLDPPRPELLAAPPGPEARAVDGQTAVLDGAMYYELRPANAALRLFRGRLGEPLSDGPVPVPEVPRSTWIAANGAHVVVGTTLFSDGARIHLLGSSDGGATFSAWGTLRPSSEGDVRLALTPKGTLFATSACLPPGAPGATPPPCDPRSAVARRADGALREMVLSGDSIAAAGPVTVSGVAVDADGILSVIGYGDKGVLAWRGPVDGAETSLLPLALPFPRRLSASKRAPATATASPTEDGGRPCSAPAFDERGALGFCLSRPAEDGLEAGAARAWVVIDRAGAVTRAPVPARVVSGAGRHVLAAGDDVRSSADGGRTWSTVATGAGSLNEIACSAAGCILGDGLTRVGWGDGDPLALDLGAPPPERPPRLGTTITCQVPAGATETALDRVLTWYQPLPQLDSLARGDALFSVLVEDPKTGVVERVRGPLDTAPGRQATPPRADALVRQRLLGPRPAPDLRAVELSGIVQRARTAAPKPLAEGASVPVLADVAWVDADTGNAGQARLAGFWRRDYGSTRVSVDAQELDGWLFSRAGSLHTGGARRSLRLEELRPPYFRAPFSPASVEYIPVDADTFAEVMLNRIWQSQQRTFFRDLHVITYAWLDHRQSPIAGRAESVAARAEARFSRRGAEKGVVLQPYSETPDDAPRRGVYRPILPSGELGAPIPVAAPSDFDAAPRRCSAGERASTPRAVWEYGEIAFADGRRPVVLETATDASWGLADGVVLHGSPGEPCGAALRASSLAGSWMIVLDGSLGRGWLLRVGPPDAGERRGPTSKLTVSPVVCREAPSRRPPADVIEAARTESPTTRMHPPGKK